VAEAPGNIQSPDASQRVAQTALEFDGRAHGQNRLRELGHHRVAYGFDHPTPEFSHRAGSQIRLAVQHGESGGVAVALEIGAGADDVGEQDGEGSLMPAQLFVNLGPLLEQPVNAVFFLAPHSNSPRALRKGLADYTPEELPRKIEGKLVRRREPGKLCWLQIAGRGSLGAG